MFHIFKSSTRGPEGGIEVIVLDETKLSNSTLMMIGEDYGMEINPYEISQDEYDSHIKSIVERFKFDTDDSKERLVRIIKDGIKVELKVT